AAHRVLFGYGMLDVSPASDFLVTPVETGDPRALALASRRTVLYWRGDGGPVPLGTGRRGLHVERTLAWSPDASEGAGACTWWTRDPGSPSGARAWSSPRASGSGRRLPPTGRPTS